MVEVKKFAIPEVWRYPQNMEATPEREVDFNHFVTVQYVDIDASNENEQGLVASTGLEFSTNMFYPFFIRMLARSTQLVVSAAVAVSVLASAIII